MLTTGLDNLTDHAPGLSSGIRSAITPEALRAMSATTADGTNSFQQAMSSRVNAGSASAAQARQAAEQLVATTLVAPILQEVRQDPFRTEMFHGGSAENMFSSMLDTHLADRIVRKANFSLVDVIYRKVMGQPAAVSPITPTTTNSSALSAPSARIDQHG
ncbi:MAG: rod-binding protein [Phycisphaeraceae bacterium]|nr:rod-binding protein [Phycisphaeraceae bacterium]